MRLDHRLGMGVDAYAVSKAGIAALTRQLALELAPHIRVNCVAPSAVDTPFLRGGIGPILFLLGDGAGDITGQVLHVNGGAYMA